jgi:hypothetical protein
MEEVCKLSEKATAKTIRTCLDNIGDLIASFTAVTLYTVDLRVILPEVKVD